MFARKVLFSRVFVFGLKFCFQQFPFALLMFQGNARQIEGKQTRANADRTPQSN